MTSRNKREGNVPQTFEEFQLWLFDSGFRFEQEFQERKGFKETFEAMRDQLKAQARADTLAELVRDDCKIVPKRATPEMTRAAQAAYESDAFGNKSAWPSDIYKLMVEAAPDSQKKE